MSVRRMMVSGSACVLLALSFAVARADNGLVASYPCDEGAGAVLRDAGGQGHNGRIIGGAAWVKGPFGTAIKLNGTDAWVDCGAEDALNISKAGSVFFWFKPETACQGGLAAWTTGTGATNQRFVISLNTLRQNRSRGDRIYKELSLLISDGQDSDRPFASNFHEPYFPPADKWLFYAVTFDGRTLDIYQDGELVYTRFQSLVPDLKGVPLWLGRCAGVGGPSDFFKGLMDDIRIYNRPLTEQEVAQAYQQTGAGREKDESGFGSIAIKPMVCPKPGTIFADLNYRGLAPMAAAPQIKAELADAAGKVVANGLVRVLPAWGRAEVDFDVHALPPGNYTIRVAADKGKPAAAPVAWPGRAKGWENVKVRNNFCWDLLVESPHANVKKEYSFNNPRGGWLYVVAEADGDVTLSLAGAKPSVLFAPGKGVNQESMRWMAEGPQTITAAGNGVLNHLIVRAIPTLTFGHYPHIGPGTGDDREFLDKYVLPDVNTLISGGNYNYPGFQEAMRDWVDVKGRRRLQIIYKPEAPKTEPDIRAHLLKTVGLSDPDFWGVIMDEFDPGDDMTAWVDSYYDGWIPACKTVLEETKVFGKMVMPYCAYNMFDFKKSSDFLRTIIDGGSCFANEVYLSEQVDEGRAWLYMNEGLADRVADWQRMSPVAVERMIVVLSYLNREFWKSGVDFRVYMDMQMEHLATRPEFFGVAGVEWYVSHYASEDYLRWQAKLCRHYGLEGATARLGSDPYCTALIRNGDFENGADGWTLRPAAEGSMAVRSAKGYGLLQDRYPYRPWTDTTFLWTKRSAGRPNVFTQQIKNLQPGRLYRLRVRTGDYNEFISGKSEDKEHAVSIEVDNAGLWDGWYKNSSCKDSTYTFAGYQFKPFGYENRFNMKIHQRVFRAKAPTATLTINDWKSEREPGGPAGQEFMFNYIDVTPYLEP